MSRGTKIPQPTNAVILICAVYLRCSSAWAEDACPSGPFETDSNAISAAIKSHPLEHRVWDASPLNPNPGTTITDGFSSFGAGGLENYGSMTLIFDAKRYVLIEVQGQWPPRGARVGPNFGQQLANQVVRRSGRAVYTTTVVRPTAEQARQLNCVANQLSSQADPLQHPSNPPPDPSVVTADISENFEKCGTVVSFSYEGTDSAYGGFSLVKDGTAIQANLSLSCALREQLGFKLSNMVLASINEAIALGKAKPRSP